MEENKKKKRILVTTMNHHLPSFICSIIFQMDSTYLDYLRKRVLPLIHPYSTFSTRSTHTNRLLYLFHSRITNHVYLCDDLETPTFVSTHFSDPYEYLNLIKKTRIYIERRDMMELEKNIFFTTTLW